MIDRVEGLIRYQSICSALAHESELFTAVTEGRLRSASVIWEANQCLVTSTRFRRYDGFAEACDVSAASGWPVYIRQTGGGVTPQGPGIINVSLALANTSGRGITIANGYRLICDPIIAELELLGISASCGSVQGAFCDGDYNVVVDGRKLVGTAQRRGRLKGQLQHEALFAHALLLHDANLDEVTEAVNRLHRLLGLDQSFDGKAHCNFTTVTENNSVSLSADLLCCSLSRCFQTDLPNYIKRHVA